MIGDASQHLPKCFCQSFAAAFLPKFFTAKVFYCTVCEWLKNGNPTDK